MRVFVNANGSKKSATGKPKDMGGIPHELGSTGFGVFHAALIAADHLDIDIKKTTFAIEGYGNVGLFASKFLTEAGATLVCASDSRGCIYNKKGLDHEKLEKIKEKGGSVVDYNPGTVLSNKDIIKVDADILITAAVPNLIIASDVSNIKAKLIIEGSNIPMTSSVEEMLHKKDILVIPDFVANAGGVISSYIEYKGGTVDEMFKTVEQKIKTNVRMVLKETSSTKTPRAAAMEIAKSRVLEKCKTCRV
ncbi:hypothetical protein HYZ41_02245 [archaeon]|nr:hypothetical protein [archaeon]